MMDKELIEAVRREKCLYDTKHVDYMNTKLKDDIWQRIGETLNFKDGRSAKKAWERLRTNHRDALRRQKKNIKLKRGSKSSRDRSWRLQDQMAFLIPYMTISASNTNMKDEAQDSDEQSQTNSTNQEIYVVEERVNIQGSLDKSEESNHSTGLLSAAGHELHERKRRKMNILNDPLDGSAEDRQDRASCSRREWECATSNANDYTMSNVKNDPLFHFFISMYQSTKNLPPLSQHSIKAGLFSLLLQEESKQLQQQDSTSSKT